MPIRYKLSASYIIICLLAFGVGGYLISVSARASLESEIKERLRWQAEAKAHALERSLDMLGRRTEDFASDGYIRREMAAALQKGSASREDAIRALRLHLRENKLPLVADFIDLRLYDGTGELVAGVQPELTGEAMVLDPRSTDLRYGSMRGMPGRGRIFAIETPLWNLERSARLGTLVSIVAAEPWATRILSSAPDEDVRIALEDRSGSSIAIASPSSARPAEVPPALAEWLKYAYVIPMNGWTLSVEMNSRPALEPVSALQSRFLAAAILTVAATVTLLFFPMRFLVRPLSRMQTAARRIAAGDFSARVEIASTDEVGDLASSFNVMAGAVQERTLRLEKTAEDLSKRGHELSVEKDRLRTVVQSMKDGLVLLDESGKIEIANEAAAPVVAYLSGQVEKIAPRRCPSGRSRTLECDACLSDPSGAARTCALDIGSSVFEIHATRLPSPGGRGGRVLVSRDVTQYVTLDERQAHQERLAVLGEVAAVIAHEMNNPLAAISMYTQMMEQEMPEETPYREHIEVIRRNTEVCKGTIRGLLDYATAAEPDILELDLHEMAREAVLFLRPLMKKARVEAVWNLDAKNPVVAGVETHLRHVFANLFINAVHAMQRTGGTLTISTREPENGEGVVVDVSDSGPGIPEPIRERIFDAFFTTKPSDTGTGLGLSTSRRIVESLGGSLTLENAESGRTTFRIALPRRPVMRSPRPLPEILMAGRNKNVAEQTS